MNEASIETQDDLKIGGNAPAIGSLVRVKTKYGIYTGIVDHVLDRLRGRWLAYVVPDERPEGMEKLALWEINNFNVPWLILKEGEGPKIELTPEVLEEKKEEDSAQSSINEVKTSEDLVKIMGKEAPGERVRREIDLVKSFGDPLGLGQNKEMLEAAKEITKEKLILDAIKDIGVASKSEVIAKAKISEIDWNNAIAELVKQNRVIKTGAKRGTKYQVQ